MPTTLTIGLAPKKVSYFDEKTKLYLTLDTPYKQVTFGDGADLQGIALGLFAMNPAIVILEGEFPEAEKEKFKQKYEVPFQVFKRADQIVADAPKAEAVVAGQSTQEATLFDVNDEAEKQAEAPKKTAAKKTAAKKTEA